MLAQTSPTFLEQLKNWAPECLLGGELVHAIAIAVQTRRLDRIGLTGSVVMDCEPGDVAEAHEQDLVRQIVAEARAVAWRYIRIFSPQISALQTEVCHVRMA